MAETDAAPAGIDPTEPKAPPSDKTAEAAPQTVEAPAEEPPTTEEATSEVQQNGESPSNPEGTAFDESHKNCAATKIQANFRGMMARKKYVRQRKSALKIQSVYKGSTQRKKYKAQKRHREQSATKIQSVWRGRKLRNSQVVQPDISDLVRRTVEAEEEQIRIKKLHSELAQKTREIIDEMGDSPDWGVDVEPLWNTCAEGPHALYETELEAFTVAQCNYILQESETSQQIVRLSKEFEEVHANALEFRDKFRLFRRAMILDARNSRTGKPIPTKWILQTEQEEQDLEDEVERERLNNIKLNMKHKELEDKIRKKETIGEGLHLMDFEQLKIENQTLAEKIEHRSNELQKLKTKTKTTVVILAHVKEKLQFVTKQNVKAQEKVSTLERELAGRRDVVSRLKQRRDELRLEVQKLKVKQGFAGSDALIRDFERRKDALPKMEDHLQSLKDTYHSLNQTRAKCERQVKMMASSSGLRKTEQEQFSYEQQSERS